MNSDTAPTLVPPSTIPDDDNIVLASIGFRERLLLFLAGLFLLVIYTGLIVARDRSVGNYWHLAVWTVCAVLGHLILRRKVPMRDPLLFPVGENLFFEIRQTHFVGYRPEHLANVA